MTSFLHACRLAVVAWLALLVACASLQDDYDPPTVDVVGIRPQNQEGTQGFAIRLRITNPNSEPISFDGIYYQLSVAGHKLVSGVANQLPKIAGYSQADVDLSAVPSVLGGLALLADLMSRPAEALDYRLSIKLDPTGRAGSIRITREGKLDMRPPGQTTDSRTVAPTGAVASRPTLSSAPG